MTLALVKMIKGWGGASPFRKEPDEGWEKQSYLPDLKRSVLFHHQRGRQANKWAHDFEGAVAARAKKLATRGLDDDIQLRCLTLHSYSGPRPFRHLPDELDWLSNQISAIADNIQKSKDQRGQRIAEPLITGFHVRIADDPPGHVDVHVHGIWEISEKNVSAVKKYLMRSFGKVWIDENVVKDPNKAAFYIAFGILDYWNLHNWPEELLKLLWGLKWPQTLRKSGWFRNGSIDLELSPIEETPPQSPGEGPQKAFSGKDGAEVKKKLDATPDTGEWQARLFPMLAPFRQSSRQRLSKTTVRRLSSDFNDLRSHPTIGEINACAILVIEAEQRDHRRTYREVLHAYGFHEQQLKEAFERVEGYFHIYLFHPSTEFMPTQDGVAWAEAMMLAIGSVRSQRMVARKRLKEEFLARHRLSNAFRRPTGR